MKQIRFRIQGTEISMTSLFHLLESISSEIDSIVSRVLSLVT